MAYLRSIRPVYFIIGHVIPLNYYAPHISIYIHISINIYICLQNNYTVYSILYVIYMYILYRANIRIPHFYSFTLLVRL